ncbi:hypothetical protein [Thalassobacillus pellis]|nr:hypothetical protein [Thalassobacillus pellis]MBM7552995.1 hypothetical protein [Thalassobacillus pellis]
MKLNMLFFIMTIEKRSQKERNQQSRKYRKIKQLINESKWKHHQL